MNVRRQMRFPCRKPSRERLLANQRSMFWIGIAFLLLGGLGVIARSDSIGLAAFVAMGGQFLGFSRATSCFRELAVARQERER